MNWSLDMKIDVCRRLLAGESSGSIAADYSVGSDNIRTARRRRWFIILENELKKTVINEEELKVINIANLNEKQRADLRDNLENLLDALDTIEQAELDFSDYATKTHLKLGGYTGEKQKEPQPEVIPVDEEDLTEVHPDTKPSFSEQLQAEIKEPQEKKMGRKVMAKNAWNRFLNKNPLIERPIDINSVMDQILEMDINVNEVELYDFLESVREQQIEEEKKDD